MPLVSAYAISIPFSFLIYKQQPNLHFTHTSSTTYLRTYSHVYLFNPASGKLLAQDHHCTQLHVRTHAHAYVCTYVPARLPIRTYVRTYVPPSKSCRYFSKIPINLHFHSSHLSPAGAPYSRNSSSLQLF